MESWERVLYIIDKEGLNKNSFSRAIGMTNNTTVGRILNEHRSPSRTTCEKIISAFPKYSFKWLLFGVGKPYATDEEKATYNNSGTIYGSQGGTNNGNYNNIGNNYNFTLPEKGNVKIIEPDGKTTIHSQGSVYIDDKNEREKELLKQIEELEKRLIERDATIKSKDETINMLKDMLLHRQ